MQLEEFKFLLSADGRALLETLELTADTHLKVATELRQSLTAGQTHAVLETVRLRQKAAAKFSRADQMFFTQAALEQASSERLSHYRARRYQARGFEQIADLGCSIGGDALGLAQTAEVIGIDRDRLRLHMARQNLRAYGLSAHFNPLEADLAMLPPLRADALFFDPARRDEGGRRLYSVHQYRPPLSLIDAWRMRVPHAAVKISPGVDYADLPPEAEAEFISHEGEVKECLLWYGDLHSSVRRRATLLPSGATLTSQNTTPKIPITEPEAFLFEPDGAVIRAHLVEEVAAEIGASQLDGQIAYLTAAQPVETSFGRWFQIDDWFPFQLKRLKRYLQKRDVGRVTIKKRGSPIDTDDLGRRLRSAGEGEAILFLTQVNGAHSVLIGKAL